MLGESVFPRMTEQHTAPASRFSLFWNECHAQVERIVDRVRSPELGRVQELLEKSASERLALPDLAELLQAGNESGAAEQFDALRSFVYSQYRRPLGNRLRYVAPIYLSSYCVDTCAYCNFSETRRNAARKRLSIEGLEDELAAVLTTGARAIELVLATDPEFSWPVLARYVAGTAALLKKEAGSGVLLCSDHFPSEAYVALREAGLWGMVQWDETLDRDAYRRWHATSPRKRHFEERMDNHGRAMAAGLEVATGALFGLADFRYEALMQIAKARFLENEYGRKPFVFGTARLKPIRGRELHPAAEAGDRAYETALMVYKIAEPAAGRWLQTRETFDLNLRNMLDGDAFTYRCGEVRPGGHRDQDSDRSPPAGSRGQFGVHELSRETVEHQLAGLEFDIDYAWIGR
jgi:2-iminoacetate synthase